MPSPALVAFSSLPADLQELCTAAQSAQQQAYAPYSGFRVGAAVRTREGALFTGANVENASYGLSICAERAAILAAVLAGARELQAAAVVSDLLPPAAPCGMCRQTLAEFASDCPVVLCGPADRPNRIIRMSLSELLPRAFSPASLRAFADQQRSHGEAGDFSPRDFRHGR